MTNLMKLSAIVLPLLLGCAPDLSGPRTTPDGSPMMADTGDVVNVQDDADDAAVPEVAVPDASGDSPESPHPNDVVILPDSPDTTPVDAGVEDVAEVTPPDTGVRDTGVDVQGVADTPDVRDVQDVPDVSDVSDTPDVVDVPVVPMDLGPRCEPGQVLCDGVCQQFQNNTTNCGFCGNTCPARPNAPAACELGTCILRCNDRFANCDGVVSNGCETNLDTVDNCGACNNRCTFAHATATCTAGVCRLGTCLTGFANCDGNPTNGCEADLANDRLNCGRCGLGVNITSDPLNCGGCGVRCSFANAAATCTAGVCVRGTCNAGFADCDGNPANGCEVDTRTHDNNCGRCGVAVSPGRRCCGGTSVPLTDVNNCGGCGIVCPGAQICELNACVCSDINVGGVRYARTACISPEGWLSCQDLARYNSHCGACFHQCGVGQTCRNGVCTN